jgi:lysozyme
MHTLLFDISFWQDDDSTPQMVDFVKAYTEGIRGAYIKVSQATYLDEDYILNWQHAKDANMPRGGYHFLDWTKPAVDQARFFTGVLQNDPGELPPVIDYECRTGMPPAGSMRQSLHDFVIIVEVALGKRPIIYTGYDYWKNYGSSDRWWADHCDLWIAYPSTLPEPPTPPLPWNTWKLWQWTWKGDGIKYGCESKQVDLDYFNGTEEEFEQWIGEEVVPPPPPKRTINSRGNYINIRNEPRIATETKVGDAKLTKADVVGETTDFYLIEAYAAKSVTSLNP